MGILRCGMANQGKMGWKLSGSFFIAAAFYVFIAFFLRCFPLSCKIFDWGELGKIFMYVFIPVFVTVYLILDLQERGKEEISFK